MAAGAFVLADELQRLQDDELDVAHEVLLDTLGADEQGAVVDRAVDALANDAGAVQDAEVYGALQSCVKYSAALRPAAVHRALDAVLSGMQAVCAPGAWDGDASLEALERYAFLLQWWVQVLEKRGAPAAPAQRSAPADAWTWAASVPAVLAAMARVLRALAEHVWSATAVRDTLVSRCMLRPVALLLENEAYMKSATVRKALFQVMGLAVKLHGQALSVQTSILQALQYYEHLAEPMAELLAQLRIEYDVERLGEDVLRDVAGKTFTSLDSKSPRTYGRFLVRMAELNPRSVLKQMSLLQVHLDSESYPIRNAMIEVQGVLIRALCVQDEFAETAADVEADADTDDGARVSAHQKQIDLFFARIEERFLDLTTFVRTKAIQTCAALCELPVKFAAHRLQMTALAVRALEDKGSNVRRNAIALLTKLVLTHPYGALHGGELDADVWRARRDVVQRELESAEAQLVFPETEVPDDADAGVKAEPGTEPGAEPGAEGATGSARRRPRKSALDLEALAASQQAMTHEDQDQLVKLRLTLRYYDDALQFIGQLEHAVPILVQLLASTFKAEVLESMEFFRVAHEYKIRGAADGVRAMVHLIWAKDNALVLEDGSQLKGVRSRLIEVYRALYFDPYPELSHAENVARISRNMIERTFGATLAELTSLEQLFALMHTERLVAPAVIDKLWDVYAAPRAIARAQRRGAILILGMLATADRALVADRIDTLLHIGLGTLGARDVRLATYTALALQRVSGSAKKVKGALSDANVRYPMAHPMFARLRAAVLMDVHGDAQRAAWFGLAEHAVQAIYALGEQPDALGTELVRHLTRAALGGGSDAYALARLLFVVGHVALKQMVYMELVERELKRRKGERDAADGGARPSTELDQVAGNAEDEIGDMMAFLKERELLYGPESLLGLYGPLVAHILRTPHAFGDAYVQRAAALTLAKLMCISSEFCDAHLALLLHVLKSAPDPVVRANVVIGLGDVAVCFGTLVDENSERLYAGLNDADLGVKKNTLMVLTHLILNGMIKVKGQLGEMAKCLEDGEPRVSDLAKLFFSELATKENAVYNNLPDIISHLSSGEHAVDEEVFANTMRFIFTFIDKERQAENVIEKLCQRFRLTTEPRQWRDIAYCLSLLPYRSERSVKKLVEGLPYYQDKLYNSDVYKRFAEILAKARQGKSAAGAKATDADLREFEEILANAASQGRDAHDAEHAAHAQLARTERRRAQRAPRRAAQRA